MSACIITYYSCHWVMTANVHWLHMRTSIKLFYCACVPRTFHKALWLRMRTAHIPQSSLTAHAYGAHSVKFNDCACVLRTCYHFLLVTCRVFWVALPPPPLSRHRWSCPYRICRCSRRQAAGSPCGSGKLDEKRNKHISVEQSKKAYLAKRRRQRALTPY